MLERLTGVDWVVVWLVGVSLWKEERQLFWWAWLAGLVTDLVWGQRLGGSSLLYLGLAGLLVVYRRRFVRFHPLFLAGVSFLGSFLVDYWWGGRWTIAEGLLLAGGVAAGVWFLKREFFRGEGEVRLRSEL